MSGLYKTSAFTKISDNIYITKTGRIENCRKIQQGLPCTRHQPVSRSLYENQIRNRISTKLSRFERNAMKLFALISKTPTGKVKEEYIQRVASYSIDGVRIPSKHEISMLEKTFLEISELSPDTKKSKIKKWLKNITLGESFTAAGFWGMRDMMHRSLLRVKNFFTGGILASTLFLTSCAPGAAPQETQQEQVIEEEEFVFNEDYFNNVLLGNAEHTPYGWEFIENIHNYSLNSIEEDKYGTYKRVRVELKQEYIDAIPLVYNDGTPIDDISEEDMRDAIKLYTDFVLNETLDSIALDNPDRYMEWADTVGKEYFTVPMLQDMKVAYDPWGIEPLPEDSDPFWLGLEEEYGLLEGNNLNNYDATPGLLYDGSRTEYLELPDSSLVQWSTYHFPLMRDGESRTSNRHLSSISFEQMDSTNFPRIYIRSNAFVRTNAETAIMGDYYNYEPDDYDNSSSTTSTDLSLVVGYTLVKPKEKWQIAGYFIEDIIWPRSSSGYPEENWTPTTDLRNDLRYVGLELE